MGHCEQKFVDFIFFGISTAIDRLNLKKRFKYGRVIKRTTEKHRNVIVECSAIRCSCYFTPT